MHSRRDLSLAGLLTTLGVLALIGFHLSPGFGQEKHPKPPHPSEEDVKRVKGYLLSMPIWPLPLPRAVGEQKFARQLDSARDIEKCCAAIAAYDSTTIREAFAEFPRHDVEMLRKQFVLIRYLFAVPDDVGKDSEHWTMLSDGYWVPIKNGRVDVLFPWYRDAIGELRLRVPSGAIASSGASLPTLEIFDYCNANFERRKPC